MTYLATLASPARKLGVANRAAKRGITRSSYERLTRGPRSEVELFDDAVIEELEAMLPRLEDSISSIEASLAFARSEIANALARVERGRERD